MNEAVGRFESPVAYFEKASSILLSIHNDARKSGVFGIAASDLIQSYRALLEKAILLAAQAKNISLEGTFSFLKCFGEEHDDLIDPHPLQDYFAAFDGHIGGERFLAWQDATNRIVDCYAHTLNLGEYAALEGIHNVERLLLRPAISATKELVAYCF